MLLPSITDYIDAFENPSGVFRTLGEPAVERDIYGVPQFMAGNSAAIFTYSSDGQRRFMKCYIRPNPCLRTIYEYIEQRRPVLLPRVRLLRDEIFVHPSGGESVWIDVVEGEWIEGETLTVSVARAARARDAARLGALADAFDRLCDELFAAEWAHGDLKPENIIVGESAPDALPVLTPVDCDAMWIPSLTGRKAVELGTSEYRHPSRTAEHFDKTIDDYPARLISVSLRAIALAPELYTKYNTPDALLLSPTEIIAGKSAAFKEISELFANRGMERESLMAKKLRE